MVDCNKQVALREGLYQSLYFISKPEFKCVQIKSREQISSQSEEPTEPDMGILVQLINHMISLFGGSLQ